LTMSTLATGDARDIGRARGSIGDDSAFWRIFVAFPPA